MKLTDTITKLIPKEVLESVPENEKAKLTDKIVKAIQDDKTISTKIENALVLTGALKAQILTEIKKIAGVEDKPEVTGFSGGSRKK